MNLFFCSQYFQQVTRVIGHDSRCSSILDSRAWSRSAHDQGTPMIEADRADYSRAKLDHDLIVSITSPVVISVMVTVEIVWSPTCWRLNDGTPSMSTEWAELWIFIGSILGYFFPRKSRKDATVFSAFRTRCDFGCVPWYSSEPTHDSTVGICRSNIPRQPFQWWVGTTRCQLGKTRQGPAHPREPGGLRATTIYRVTAPPEVD